MFKITSKRRLQRVNANDDNDVMNAEPFTWCPNRAVFQEVELYRIWRFEPWKAKMVGTVKAENRRQVPEMASHFVFVPSNADSMGPDQVRKAEIYMYNTDPVTKNDVIGE